MMFLRHRPGSLAAISQPAHAFVAGQLLRAWRDPLPAALLLAAEQHDLAWLDWERAPDFDPATRLPKAFMDVGAAEHAPRWRRAVDQALAAWGRHVALLISRHGGLIYTRFMDRHQASEADRVAARAYLDGQAASEAAWAGALGLGPAALERETGLIALADALSLGLCGGLPLPMEAAGPGPDGAVWRYRMEPGFDGACTLSPWPFAGDRVAVEVDTMPIPDGGFPDAAAMRPWLAAGVRSRLEVSLVRGA